MPNPDPAASMRARLVAGSYPRTPSGEVDYPAILAELPPDNWTAELIRATVHAGAELAREDITRAVNHARDLNHLLQLLGAITGDPLFELEPVA